MSSATAENQRDREHHEWTGEHSLRYAALAARGRSAVSVTTQPAR